MCNQCIELNKRNNFFPYVYTNINQENILDIKRSSISRRTMRPVV